MNEQPPYDTITIRIIDTNGNLLDRGEYKLSNLPQCRYWAKQIKQALQNGFEVISVARQTDGKKE